MNKPIRLALPSQGRLYKDTLALFQACDLKITQSNPRQYVAQIANLPQIEIWFQRSRDVVRHVRDGVVDLGIGGLDIIGEHGGAETDLAIIHDDLGYSHCTLDLIVPETWTNVNTLSDLSKHAAASPQPLRVVSKFPRLTTQFLQKHHLQNYHLLKADGALEAAPHMGTADFIVDLVETGTTLRENRLKRLEDGRILNSRAVFFGNRHALSHHPETLTIARQILEMFEAHLRAEHQYNIIANVRGQSPTAVAKLLFTQSELGGLQGPTISPVYPAHPSTQAENWYAISLVVQKNHLHTAVQQIRAIGGSGVVVLPALFTFEEVPERWTALKENLGLS
jgi:ATP phosphoribosyltransferase